MMLFSLPPSLVTKPGFRVTSVGDENHLTASQGKNSSKFHWRREEKVGMFWKISPEHILVSLLPRVLGRKIVKQMQACRIPFGKRQQRGHKNTKTWSAVTIRPQWQLVHDSFLLDQCPHLDNFSSDFFSPNFAKLYNLLLSSRFWNVGLLDEVTVRVWAVARVEF